MKRCYECNVEKELVEFSRHSKNRDGYQTRCKACIALYQKCWSYGVTIEWMHDKLLELDGKCEICRRPFENGKFHLDHIKEGGPRSLLCRSCNLLIGYAEERTEWLESAVQYLEKYGTKWDTWPWSE